MTVSKNAHMYCLQLRDRVTKDHTERASKERKVRTERIEQRHPSALENLGHISFEVGRDDDDFEYRIFETI